MFWRRFIIRAFIGLTLVFTIGASFGLALLIESKGLIFFWSTPAIEQTLVKDPFPVSVNSYTQVINNNPNADLFFTDTLASAPASRNNWWNKVAAVFANRTWYQNLASPVSRIIVIWPGERKEEVTKHIGDILHWNSDDRATFQQLIDVSDPILTEGKYFPGQYVAHRGATPADIQSLISESFRTEVLERYTPKVAAQVPLEDALIIASLLEREASDFSNMREVAGVIWNRLFIDMPLQLDATLQYVKGSKSYEPKWWPIVRPNDKFTTSPYNTYENPGLPPAPIANPSAEAVLAALNPIVTECLFYFHTNNGDYHCSINYEDHVEKLRSLYGRGS
jgi:hypothetical protein